MDDEDVKIVSIDIRGQRYHVRSNLDPEYITELAAYVDEKMRIAADETPSGDSMRAAIIGALNIADELFRFRRHESTEGRILRRAEAIEQMVDRVLAGEV